MQRPTRWGSPAAWRRGPGSRVQGPEPGVRSQRHTGRGGDNTHHPECMRARYAQHALPFAVPRSGDIGAMIHEARRCGCPDLVHDGRGRVVDPHGRPVTQSAWVAITG